MLPHRLWNVHPPHTLLRIGKNTLASIARSTPTTVSINSRSSRPMVLDGRVPPAIEVHHVRRCGEVQPRSAGLERQHEERNRFVLLKASHQIPAFLDLGFACEIKPGRPNTPPKKEANGAVTSRNWVNTSAFSCLAAITSQISRRRAHLPLSSSAHAPSPKGSGEGQPRLSYCAPDGS